MTDPLSDQLIDTVGDQGTGRSLPRALTPFRTPAYRRLAVALVFSTFALGAWTVALVWEVIRIGGGPAQLSVATTAGAVGVLLPALIGGSSPTGSRRSRSSSSSPSPSWPAWR